MELNVKKFIKFINMKQWDKVAGFFDADAELSDPFCPEPVRGIDKVIDVLKEQVNIFPDYGYEHIRTLSDENHAAIELVRSGKKITWNKRDFDIDYSLPEVIMVETSGNRIKSYRGFFDIGRVLRLLEQADRLNQN